MKLKLLCTLCTAIAIGCAATAVTAAQANYDDLWGSRVQGGMGLSIGQREDTLVVAWYLYDADRQPVYLMFSGQLDGNRLSASLYRTRGPQPGVMYDPRQVQRLEVGTAELEFLSPDEAILQYSYDGKSGRVPFERFVFDMPAMFSGKTYGAVYLQEKQCEGNGVSDYAPYSYTSRITSGDVVVPQFVDGSVTARGNGVYVLQPQVIYKKGHTYQKNWITLSVPSDRTRFSCSYDLVLGSGASGWGANNGTLNCNVAMEGGARHPLVEGTYTGPLVVNRVMTNVNSYLVDYSAVTTNGNIRCAEKGWIVLEKQTP